METRATAGLTSQQWTGSTADSESTSIEKDQAPPLRRTHTSRTGSFRDRMSRTLSVLLPNAEKPEVETRRHSGCFSSVFTRTVTRSSSFQTHMSPNSLSGNEAGSETTTTNEINPNVMQIWSPVKKTMITIPSYDSGRKAYSLAMKAYILDDKQLYDLSRGESIEGIDTSKIDLSDLKGDKPWNLQIIHRKRKEWVFELSGHLSSGHGS
ncbi:hypothetical protein [Endozoicomonas sp. SESOKO1]|uniref:hypothetical protein n=1 Tax=Endozoicomonas sp. SESOKO1 TaxID=2828742 RepID=UPI0021492013|nr:hypothetical protein [Endozoicomonas sp. SESOKO1]